METELSTSPTRLTDIDSLLGSLTLDEKISLLDGSDFWHTQPIERLGIPKVMVSDGPHGLRKQAEAADHLGLNASVPATCFPPAAGLASSWDRVLFQRVGAALGAEAKAENVAVLLGPGINMKRSPLCGRNFEYLSEDPFLAGVLAAEMVKGVQGAGVGASLKHFAANNQETDRLTVSANVDERTLREIYLPAFERVVKDADPWTLMCSYNRINGEYASENRWLLTDVLRDEWGFGGLVVSDWGAVNRRELGVHAGLDLEMPSSAGAGSDAIRAAVADGRLTVDEIDTAARRVLELIQRSQREIDENQTSGFDVDAHHVLAREAAAASVVLLKNEGALLPLDPAAGGPIAVIGEFARTPRFQGAGSSQVNPTRVDSALDALRSTIGEDREILFAPGFEIDAESLSPELRDEAVRAASRAEVALLFLGLPPSYESEGYDRDHMDLPEPQLELLRGIAEVTDNIVVVLSNGSVVTVSDWEDRAQAILEGWLLGQAGGRALADLILGRLSPSGRLAETIPVRLGHNPTVGAFPGENGEVRYGEGLLIGYRWYDARELPVSYPFGHGLTYSEFAYSLLELDVSSSPDVNVTVRLLVRNIGGARATETVQVYVSDPVSSVYRPRTELRGFERITLEPGESTTVSIELGRRAFTFWDTSSRDWYLEGGEYRIDVGASSRDTRLSETITLSGETRKTTLTELSTVDDFMDNRDAGSWLRQSLGDGEYGHMLFDSQHGRMMRAFPVLRLARFDGFPVSEQEVREAIARFR